MALSSRLVKTSQATLHFGTTLLEVRRFRQWLLLGDDFGCWHDHDPKWHEGSALVAGNFNGFALR
jgi:hypothetical protein